MKINPKGMLFWAAMFCVAGCYTLDIVRGVIAFAVLAVVVIVWG